MHFAKLASSDVTAAILAGAFHGPDKTGHGAFGRRGSALWHALCSVPAEWIVSVPTTRCYCGENYEIMTTVTDSALSRYIRMVHAFPLLSREEELERCHRWRQSLDDRAKDELVRSNLRYSVTMARKYLGYGLPLAELIAQGNIGIVQALSKFEPERENRFTTYAAYWIRAYILSYIIRCWSLVGLGSARSKLLFKLRRERIRIHNLVGAGDHDHPVRTSLV